MTICKLYFFYTLLMITMSVPQKITITKKKHKTKIITDNTSAR